MKNLVFLISILVSIVGCAGHQQESKISLYDIKIPITSTDSQEESYIEAINVGPDEKKLSILIFCKAKADESGCLKISEIKISQMGGSADTVISNVKHSVIPDCVMKWNSQDETLYQTALIQLSYESRKFLKTYNFNGNVALILGNGDFKAL